MTDYRRKLRFEKHEDRRVLATFTVTEVGDGAVRGPGGQPGTLRQAVFDANFIDDGSVDEIVFALPPGEDTIRLGRDANGVPIPQLARAAAELFIADAVSIAGPGMNALTIEAFDPTPTVDNGDGSRIFRITVGAESVPVSGPKLSESDPAFDGDAASACSDVPNPGY